MVKKKSKTKEQGECMKIVFLGSGNVATHLAQALAALGHEILQVYSRTLGNARILTEKVGATPTDRLEELNHEADLYIFSLKDDALAEVINAIPHTRGIWAHTAGSVSIDLFASRAKKYGVLYPLQTFSRDRVVHFKQVPFFIEGSDEETTRVIEDLARSLSENVHRIDSEKRAVIHLSAVFACNFTNHMYALAEEIIGEQNIPFEVLKPLILETAHKVMEMTPRDAQTGPAVRYDEKVMQAHMERINSPSTRELYTLLSKSIHSRSR